jgi:hypothetical protein
MTTARTEQRADKKALPAQRRPAVASSKAKPTRTADAKAKAERGRNNADAVRAGSKMAKILELLKRPKGATLNEIMKATAWQAHSVRGFLSGTVRKKLGLLVDSVKHDDATRTYRISSK